MIFEVFSTYQYVHSKDLTGIGEYQYGMILYRKSTGTQLWQYRVKIADCTDPTIMKYYDEPQSFIRDANNMLMATTTTGEVLFILARDIEDDGTPDKIIFMFQNAALSYIANFQFDTNLFPVDVLAHNQGVDNQFLLTVTDGTQYEILNVIWDKTGGTMSMSYRRNLPTASASHKSRIAFASSHFFMALGGTDFGVDTSYENAAIFKFTTAFLPVDTCYSFSGNTSITISADGDYNQCTGNNYTLSQPNYVFGDITSSIVNEDRHSTEPYSFQMLETTLNTTTSNTCDYAYPTITATFSTNPMTLYATTPDTYGWNIGTSGTGKGYNMVLLLNGTSISVPFVSVDMSTFTTDGIMGVDFIYDNMAAWYDDNITYLFTWKIEIPGVPLANTHEYSVTVVSKNDPVLLNTLTNFNLRIGQRFQDTLSFFSNLTIDGSASGVNVE